MTIKFVKMDNNVLRIKFDGNKLDKEELQNNRDKYGSDRAFLDITEPYWTNGWGVNTADQLNQMSECFVISEESTSEDDGSITLYGKSWSNIHNYQIIDPIDELCEKGYYDFYLWEDFKDGVNFPNPYLQ